MLALQDPCPAFSLPATQIDLFDSTQQSGKPFVLFFYPKNHTEGCTVENADFNALLPAFHELGVNVFGLSRDTLGSHKNFSKKLGLSFPLLADPEETVCTLFSVMKAKKMFGKDVKGIDRSTFLFDKEGHLVRVWRSVKVPNHAAEVLEAARQFTAS